MPQKSPLLSNLSLLFFPWSGSSAADIPRLSLRSKSHYSFSKILSLGPFPWADPGFSSLAVHRLHTRRDGCVCDARASTQLPALDLEVLRTMGAAKISMTQQVVALPLM